jgi:hypothetical protein
MRMQTGKPWHKLISFRWPTVSVCLNHLLCAWINAQLPAFWLAQSFFGSKFPFIWKRFIDLVVQYKLNHNMKFLFQINVASRNKPHILLLSFAVKTFFTASKTFLNNNKRCRREEWPASFSQTRRNSFGRRLMNCATGNMREPSQSAQSTIVLFEFYLTHHFILHTLHTVEIYCLSRMWGVGKFTRFS